MFLFNVVDCVCGHTVSQISIYETVSKRLTTKRSETLRHAAAGQLIPKRKQDSVYRKRELSLVEVLNTPLYLREFSFYFHSVLFYTGFILIDYIPNAGRTFDTLTFLFESAVSVF